MVMVAAKSDLEAQQLMSQETQPLLTPPSSEDQNRPPSDTHESRIRRGRTLDRSRNITDSSRSSDDTRSRSPASESLVQLAIAQTFKSTAHLANLLPTGTVLAFQLLSPIFTNQGDCDAVSQSMTAALVALCGLSCVLLSFTDSFKDQCGDVRYGIATFKGIWVIDGTPAPPPEEAAKYKVRFIDFFHATMSVLVFAAVALFDQSVVQCFYPLPSKEEKEVLTALPVAIGVFCSMLFVVFPTTRHGIGFPIVPHDA